MIPALLDVADQQEQRERRQGLEIRHVFRSLIRHVATQLTRTKSPCPRSLKISVDMLNQHSNTHRPDSRPMRIECASGMDTPLVNF